MLSRTYIVVEEETSGSSTGASSTLFSSDTSSVVFSPSLSAVTLLPLTSGAAAGLLDAALLHPGVRGGVRGGGCGSSTTGSS